MKEACAVDIKWQHWRTPWQLIRTSASPSNNTNHIERAEWKLLLNFPHPINCCRHNTRWISCRAWWTADKQLRKRRNSIDRRTFLLLLLQRIPVAVSAGVAAAAGVCTEGKGGGTSIDMVVAENEKNARWWWLAEKSYTFLCRTLIQKKELLAKNHVRIRLPARAYAAIWGTFAVLTRHAPIPQIVVGLPSRRNYA